MAPPNKTEASVPGFQGSETTRCEVTIYSHGSDPLLFNNVEGQVPFDGRNAQSQNPSLVSISTSKTLTGAGTFQISLKQNAEEGESILDTVIDDDWVDLVFKRHDRVWLVMRGLVDDVRRTRSVGGNGATSTAYTITGRDFQKIWEQTEAWFNVHNNENAVGAASVRMFNILENVSGPPDVTVESFLLDFLRELDGFGRANWYLPKTMPGIGGKSFAEAVDFRSEGFSGTPLRDGVSPNFMNPSGTLWSLAKEWSDPGFTELFCDVGTFFGQANLDDELTPEDATIAVFFRDKPFMVRKSTAAEINLTSLVNETGASDLAGGKDSAWFQLPTFIVPRQQIVNDDLGRSGAERLNAFIMAPQMTDSLIQTGSVELGLPFWNTADMKRHGMRRYDISSRYVARDADIITMSSVQRSLLVDWFCLNPYFLNGTISLGIARPDIRVGTRIRIPGDSGNTGLDETFYVEVVSHSWNFTSGGRTTLSVTRGYRDDDATILELLDDFASKFEESSFVPPEKRTSPNPVKDPDPTEISDE